MIADSQKNLSNNQSHTTQFFDSVWKMISWRAYKHEVYRDLPLFGNDGLTQD